MMAVVMGVAADDEDTLDRACDLGLAFQLGNIARDVAEDDRGGRCYLPAEWLAEADIPPGEQLRPCYRPALVAVAQRLAALAADYEASARVGAARLGFRQRWAILSAAGIYGAIARKVAARGPRVARACGTQGCSPRAGRRSAGSCAPGFRRCGGPAPRPARTGRA